MSGIFNEIHETKNCANCEKIHKWQYDYTRHIVTEHHRYNTIVCSIGYGSFLTILNLLKDNLNYAWRISVILPLMLSIAIFVYVEMQNIVSLKYQIQRLTAAIHSNCQLSVIKQVYNEFYEESQKKNVKYQILKNISVISGFLSVIILAIRMFL